MKKAARKKAATKKAAAKKAALKEKAAAKKASPLRIQVLLWPAVPLHAGPPVAVYVLGVQPRNTCATNGILCGSEAMLRLHWLQT